MSHPASRILWMCLGIVTAAAGTRVFVSAGESVWMAVTLFVAGLLIFGLLIPWMLKKRVNLLLIFTCMVTVGSIAFFAGKGGTVIVIGVMYVCLPMIIRIAEQVGRENRISGEQ